MEHRDFTMLLDLSNTATSLMNSLNLMLQELKTFYCSMLTESV